MTTTTQTRTPFTLEHFTHWAAELVLDNGNPWNLEPFQQAFAADLFTGIPECWLIVPEGNGKTTLIAGLALYYCAFAPMPAEIPVAASSREQAGIIYRQAEGFILRSPCLYDLVHSKSREAKGKRKLEVPRFVALDGYRRINHYTGSRIQVFAADERTGDGVIALLAILDELHRHKHLGLYRTWAGKRSKRGGQIIAISTAGEPGGEFEETREKIRQSATDVARTETFVRAASEDIVLHEWAVPADGDVEDLDLVARANPLSQITADTLAAKRRSPTMTLPHWRRFTCNLPTRGEHAAIQESEWFDAATTEEIPVGVPVWLGLDVAWKWDTTAMVALWVPLRRRPDLRAVVDGEPVSEPRPAQPDLAAEFLDRLNLNEGEYRLFGPATILEPPRDGRSLNPEAIERALVLIHQRNPLDTVVMDTSQAQDIAFWIESELGARVVERTQSPKFFADDYERFMEALRNGWLHHQGDAGLTRHVLNAVTHIMPFGDARFDRPSQTRRGGDQDRRVIDALTAASMVNAAAAGEFGTGLEPLVAWG